MKKKEIQDKFKAKLGLDIDVVKDGSGNTNDGNTARRFFENEFTTADKTGTFFFSNIEIFIYSSI